MVQVVEARFMLAGRCCGVVGGKVADERGGAGLGIGGDIR